MGNRAGSNKKPTNDPFYSAVPPIEGPYEEYGYENDPQMAIANYGRPVQPPVQPYGGLYAQGLNQVPGVAPWNYGNYYLGNTTMQMMPSMLNKVYAYGQIQARAMLANAGLLGSTPMLQNNALLSSYNPPMFNLPQSAPLMAAATPLPIAFNPLIQGMYPMATMNPNNWMTPSSFMSALTAGPMPYRPPSFDFPSNVGMVMALPYGTPNPFFSSPSYTGFNSAPNYNTGSSWCCCCYCMPISSVPTSSFTSNYPQSYSAPYSAPAPASAPLPVVNFQQIPPQQPTYAPAPPAIASANYSAPIPAGAPLYSSQGSMSNVTFSQPSVMATNIIKNNTTNVQTSSNVPLPVYNATDKSQYLIGQTVTSSLSDPTLNYNQLSTSTPSTSKSAHQFLPRRESFSDRVRRHIPSISRSNYTINQTQTRSDPVLPPILHGQLISDSGWLPKTSTTYQKLTSLLPGNRRKRSVYTPDYTKPTKQSNNNISFIPRRRRRHSNSSASEYDCAICQQERDKRRLREHYGSSTVSSLLSSKPPHKQQRSPNGSASSKSKSSTPTSSQRGGYKSHRRHPTKIKIRSKTPSPEKSSSPVLRRQSPVREIRVNDTIHEEDEKDLDNNDDDEEEKKTVDSSNGSDTKKPDSYGSKISLTSVDE